MKPCTSNYAVEARASAWESAAKSLRTPAHKSVPFGRNVARLLDEAAALLRALVAERDHACARGRDEALARAAELARVRHLDWRLPHPDDARDGEVCDDESCCADIANAIAGLRDDPAAPTAYARGWREGAGAMREACAREAAEHGGYASNDMDADHLIDRMQARGRMDMADEIRDAIRALPLPEPQA